MHVVAPCDFHTLSKNSLLTNYMGVIVFYMVAAKRGYPIKTKVKSNRLL
jgi:hypothetical protein